MSYLYLLWDQGTKCNYFYYNYICLSVEKLGKKYQFASIPRANRREPDKKQRLHITQMAVTQENLS